MPLSLLHHHRHSLLFILILPLAGQLLFWLFSGSYTAPRYESRMYATTGIQFDGSDLHKLNEGAHYFAQTMIGWTRFPNFRDDLVRFAGLPDDTAINMHIQERQNFIFTLTTRAPINLEQLKKTKAFLQGKMDEYNEKTKTSFVLTSVDYEQADMTKNYSFGAFSAFLLSLILSFAGLFIRKEFFPPKLKF